MKKTIFIGCLLFIPFISMAQSHCCQFGIGLNISRYSLLLYDPPIIPVEINSQYRFSRLFSLDMTAGFETQSNNKALSNTNIKYRSMYGKVGFDLSSKNGPLYLRLSYVPIFLQQEGEMLIEGAYWQEKYHEEYHNEHLLHNIELGFGGKLLFADERLLMLAGFRIGKIINQKEVDEMLPNYKNSTSIYHIPSAGLVSTNNKLYVPFGFQLSLLYIIDFQQQEED